MTECLVAIKTQSEGTDTGRVLDTFPPVVNAVKFEVVNLIEGAAFSEEHSVNFIGCTVSLGFLLTVRIRFSSIVAIL